MKMISKHVLSLAIIATFIPAFITTANAQLHLEIAKAPEQAPKIAIVPFSNDNSLYPIVENDLNRSGKFSSASKNLPATASMNQIQAGEWQNAGVPYVVVGQTKAIDVNNF